MIVQRPEESHKMEAWCRQELSIILKFDVEEELVSYLLSMQTVKDVEEYLSELLGTSSPKAQQFQREFFSRWHPPARLPSPPSPLEEDLLEELVRPQTEEMILFRGEGTDRKKGGGGRGGGGGGGRQKDHKKDARSLGPPPGFTTGLSTQTTTHPNAPHKTHLHPHHNGTATTSTTSQSSLHSSGVSSSSKAGGASGRGVRKKRFVPLLSSEGQSRAAMSLPGRHICQCLAQKHELINNCVECGRIVCSQEGSGPCIFCGTLVVSTEEEEMLAKDSKKVQKVKEKLLKKYQLKDGDRAFEHFKSVLGASELEKAVEHRNKLLNFDQTSAQRTRVLDDERDYFSVEANSWLTSGEKLVLRKREDELREKRHGSQRNKAVTLDFAGRKVVEEENLEIYDEMNLPELPGLEKGRHKKSGEGGRRGEGGGGGGGDDDYDISNPFVSANRPKFKFIDRSREGKGEGGGRRLASRGEGTLAVEKPQNLRLQDRELQEMRDEGMCLSMHQPWATLLVAGIKQVEGRSWYTAHRGRLWIAAAAKKPSIEEIQVQENFYKTLYGEEALSFPSNYPTGCLLGCVNVVDCQSQEEYREKYPEGESESAYVFVCDNPQLLVTPLPVRGQHKTWKLPKDIHRAAKLACQPVS